MKNTLLFSITTMIKHSTKMLAWGYNCLKLEYDVFAMIFISTKLCSIWNVNKMLRFFFFQNPKIIPFVVK